MRLCCFKRLLVHDAGEGQLLEWLGALIVVLALASFLGWAGHGARDRIAGPSNGIDPATADTNHEDTVDLSQRNNRNVLNPPFQTAADPEPEQRDEPDAWNADRNPDTRCEEGFIRGAKNAFMAGNGEMFGDMLGMTDAELAQRLWDLRTGRDVVDFGAAAWDAAPGLAAAAPGALSTMKDSVLASFADGRTLQSTAGMVETALNVMLIDPVKGAGRIAVDGWHGSGVLIAAAQSGDCVAFGQTLRSAVSNAPEAALTFLEVRGLSTAATSLGKKPAVLANAAKAGGALGKIRSKGVLAAVVSHRTDDVLRAAAHSIAKGDRSSTVLRLFATPWASLRTGGVAERWLHRGLSTLDSLIENTTTNVSEVARVASQSAHRALDDIAGQTRPSPRPRLATLASLQGHDAFGVASDFGTASVMGSMASRPMLVTVERAKERLLGLVNGGTSRRRNGAATRYQLALDHLDRTPSQEALRVLDHGQQERALKAFVSASGRQDPEQAWVTVLRRNVPEEDRLRFVRAYNTNGGGLPLDELVAPLPATHRAAPEFVSARIDDTLEVMEKQTKDALYASLVAAGPEGINIDVEDILWAERQLLRDPRLVEALSTMNQPNVRLFLQGYFAGWRSGRRSALEGALEAVSDESWARFTQVYERPHIGNGTVHGSRGEPGH